MNHRHVMPGLAPGFKTQMALSRVLRRPEPEAVLLLAVALIVEGERQPAVQRWPFLVGIALNGNIDVILMPLIPAAVIMDLLGLAVIASEAKQSRSCKHILDCFVASLLAMTNQFLERLV